MLACDGPGAILVCCCSLLHTVFISVKWRSNADLSVTTLVGTVNAPRLIPVLSQINVKVSWNQYINASRNSLLQYFQARILAKTNVKDEVRLYLPAFLRLSELKAYLLAWVSLQPVHWTVINICHKKFTIHTALVQKTFRGDVRCLFATNDHPAATFHPAEKALFKA